MHDLPGSGLMWMADAQQTSSEFGADDWAGMFISLGGVATVASGATVFVVWLHVFLLRRYPVLVPPGQQPPGAPVPERPIRVLIAILMMVPVVMLWPLFGAAYLVVVTRADSDNSVLWIIGLVMLAISLLLAALIVAGMWRAGQGRSARLLIGTALATGVFFLTVGVLLSIVGVVSVVADEGSNFFLMAAMPMMVGLYAAAVLVLMVTRPARAWFRARPAASGAVPTTAAAGQWRTPPPR
jgi:hypothetical protein